MAHMLLQQRYLWRPLNDNECKTSRNFDWRNKRTKQNSKLSFSSCHSHSSHSPPATYSDKSPDRATRRKTFRIAFAQGEAFSLAGHGAGFIPFVRAYIYNTCFLYIYTILYIVYYINLYKLFNLICLSICPSICQSVSQSVRRVQFRLPPRDATA